MKRFLAAILASAMMLGAAGCAAKNDTPASSNSGGNTATEAPKATDAPTDAPKATDAPTDAPKATDAPVIEEKGAGGPDSDSAEGLGLPGYTGDPVELRFEWWGNDERAELTNKVIAEFMKAYPNIKITGQPNGGTSDHFQIVDTEIQGNNGPDLIQFGGNYPDYVQFLEPMDAYLGKQLTINNAANFDQTALIPATKDGKLWVASLGTNTLVLAYNKTLLESAGCALPKDNMTWDEMLAYGREIKEKLPSGVYPFVDNSTNQANYITYFYTQQGTDIWDGEKTYATVESAQKWLQLWADMRSEGLIPDADTTAVYAETGADSSALVAGKAAIGMLWSNQVAGYQSSMTDSLASTTLPKGGKPSYVIQMSQYLGVYNQSKNKEAAMLFVNFMTTSPIAGEILKTNRGIPCSPVVRQAISASATELDASVYHIYDVIADRTIPQGPNLPNDIEFVNELALIGQSVGYGVSSVEQGAKDIQALVDRLIVK